MTTPSAAEGQWMPECWTLENDSLDPVGKLRLLLAVCGNDTQAMIEKHQCQPLLAALDALLARAEAAERERHEDRQRLLLAEAVEEAARAALDHWWFANDYGRIECLHCGEMHHAATNFPHAAGCQYVALRDAIAALDARIEEAT